MATYKYTSGLGNAAAYQVSGKPFVSGGINCGDAEDGDDSDSHVEIAFPAVTRWVCVSNIDTDAPVKVGFSVNGLKGSNYYEVGGRTISQRLELKCTNLFVSGSPNVSVAAGLTGIPREYIIDNYTGSAGI